MAVAKEDVVSFIDNMTVLEMSEFVKELEEKYAKDTNPNNLKEAIYEYRCGDCQHLEIDMPGMKLHQDQKGHYSDPTRIKKT